MTLERYLNCFFVACSVHITLAFDIKICSYEFQSSIFNLVLFLKFIIQLEFMLKVQLDMTLGINGAYR